MLLNRYNGSVDGPNRVMSKLNTKTYNDTEPLHMLAMNVKNKYWNAIIRHQMSQNVFVSFFAVKRGSLAF